MKPDYKNWMPKGMVLTAAAATAVLLLLFVMASIIPKYTQENQRMQMMGRHCAPQIYAKCYCNLGAPNTVNEWAPQATARRV